MADSISNTVLMRIKYVANDSRQARKCSLEHYRGPTSPERGCVVLDQPEHVGIPGGIRCIPTATRCEAAAAGLRRSRAPYKVEVPRRICDGRLAKDANQSWSLLAKAFGVRDTCHAGASPRKRMADRAGILDSQLAGQ